MWFEQRLDELLAVVLVHGLPTCILTLTADEISETRFEEISSLETFLNRYLHAGAGNTRASYDCAPVECTCAFMQRHSMFMEGYVLGGERIFGKVLHSLVRFEVQGRGSLHSHILLWLDPVDALHVRNEVVAYMPATLPHDAVIPEGSSEEEERARLFSADELALRSEVTRKQAHKCDERCRGPGMTRMCKDMHPHPPNEEGTKFNHGTKRWDYLRPAQKAMSEGGQAGRRTPTAT